MARNYITEYQLKNQLQVTNDASKQTMMHMARSYGKPITHIAVMLGQVEVESATKLGPYTACRENLFYRAVTLIKTWPTRFKNIATAMLYANNPEKLANYVYANRMGNGADTSGDGYRNRGVGAISLTGDDNLDAFMLWAGMDKEHNRDEICKDPHLYFATAIWFFDTNNIWQIIPDTYISNIDIRKVSCAVNRGDSNSTLVPIGLTRRIKNTRRLIEKLQ
jgi:putative chitinase